MSLINQYLEKSGKRAETGRQEVDVPPVLKSGGARRAPGNSYRLSMAIFLAGIAVVGVYLYRLPTTVADHGRPAVAMVLEQNPGKAEAKPAVARPEPEPVQVQVAMLPEPPVLEVPSERLVMAAEPPLRDYRRPEPVEDYRRWYPPPAPPEPEPAKPVEVVGPAPQVTVRDPGEGDKGSPRERAGRYYQLALAAQQDGRTRQAEKLYRQVLTEVPSHGEALNNLAVLLMEQKPTEAEELLRRLLSVDADNAAAHNNLGMINLQRREHVAAVKSFTRALESEPASRTALVNLAWLTRQQGDHIAAGEYFEKLIAHGLYDRGILLAYAGMLEQQGTLPRAQSIYRLALESAELAGEKVLVRQIRDRIRLLDLYYEEAAEK